VSDVLSASNSPRWNTRRTIGSDSTSRNADAGSSMKKICRSPRAMAERMPATSSRAARREIAGKSTVEIATLNTPCGSRYSRKAASIARGAWSLTSVAKIVSTVRFTLMSPSPSVTGSISTSTWRTRGLRHPNEIGNGPSRRNAGTM
jgi:hypothetical protein